jgi:hypothetical protein
MPPVLSIKLCMWYARASAGQISSAVLTKGRGQPCTHRLGQKTPLLLGQDCSSAAGCQACSSRLLLLLLAATSLVPQLAGSSKRQSPADMAMYGGSRNRPRPVQPQCG